MRQRPTTAWPKDIDALKRSCPVVASYGAKDRTLPGAAASSKPCWPTRMCPAISRSTGGYYSFMNNWGTPRPLRFVERITGFAYSEPESEDAWRRILAFFDDHLSAG